MKIGILTSSRADFGIYLPLLKKMREDPYFELKIIAFGTHLSGFHGKTIQQIETLGFKVSYTVESMLLTDSENAIASAIGLTTMKFAEFWKYNQHDFDLIFCLGDRYEMLAAVMAGVPFQLKFAHLHGGETTLGAIDNVFRHSITLASSYHFVSTEAHSVRVKEICGSDQNIYNVGALSLDNLNDITLLDTSEFVQKWNINLDLPTILTTFHPETVAVAQNEYYADQLVKAINELIDFQFLITMPNADTAGNTIRQALIENFTNHSRVFLIENLGTDSYFTAMKYCVLLMGNTSSGIIEAASYAKPVVNLGDRQSGRTAGNNVLHVPIESSTIIEAVKIAAKLNFSSENLYWNEGATAKIINILKGE